MSWQLKVEQGENDLGTPVQLVTVWGGDVILGTEQVPFDVRIVKGGLTLEVEPLAIRPSGRDVFIWPGRSPTGRAAAEGKHWLEIMEGAGPNHAVDSDHGVHEMTLQEAFEEWARCVRREPMLRSKRAESTAASA